MPVAQERERAGAHVGDRAVLGDHRQVERPAAHAGGRADPLQERQVLREAAERDVLAVVGRRVRVSLASRQRLHRAAERRPRLVERDVGAAVDEVERGREPGQPASDHRDHHASSPRATIASFDRVEGRTSPSNTS